MELKIKRILGIYGIRITTKTKKALYTTHHYFFDFVIKNKEQFIFDKNVDLTIIQKIYSFCNLSVHQGLMPFSWQMYFAIEFCSFLFYTDSSSFEEKWSINGAVKIKDFSILKQKLEEYIETSYPKSEHIVTISWGEPEALVIK